MLQLIECQQHGFSVWSPTNHVCKYLEGSHEGSGLSTFKENVELDNGSIYAWLEFSYRTPEALSIPQYYHELVKLASFQEFLRWTTEEKEKAFRKARKLKEQELANPKQ